ncbi:MAG: TerB family tellurite resistance protein [Myxococcota bacterium]
MDHRTAYCHLIASVLAADGIITDNERIFLSRVMDRMGLTPKQREAVTHFEGAHGAARVARQLPEEVRRELLDELLAAALVDGKLSPLETRVVGELTRKLGFKE